MIHIMAQFLLLGSAHAFPSFPSFITKFFQTDLEEDQKPKALQPCVYQNASWVYKLANYAQKSSCMNLEPKPYCQCVGVQKAFYLSAAQDKKIDLAPERALQELAFVYNQKTQDQGRKIKIKNSLASLVEFQAANGIPVGCLIKDDNPDFDPQTKLNEHAKDLNRKYIEFHKKPRSPEEYKSDEYKEELNEVLFNAGPLREFYQQQETYKSVGTENYSEEHKNDARIIAELAKRANAVTLEYKEEIAEGEFVQAELDNMIADKIDKFFTEDIFDINSINPRKSSFLHLQNVSGAQQLGNSALRDLLKHTMSKFGSDKDYNAEDFEKYIHAELIKPVADKDIEINTILGQLNSNICDRQIAEIKELMLIERSDSGELSLPASNNIDTSIDYIRKLYSTISSDVEPEVKKLAYDELEELKTVYFKSWEGRYQSINNEGEFSALKKNRELELGLAFCKSRQSSEEFPDMFERLAKKPALFRKFMEIRSTIGVKQSRSLELTKKVGDLESLIKDHSQTFNLQIAGQLKIEKERTPGLTETQYIKRTLDKMGWRHKSFHAEIEGKKRAKDLLIAQVTKLKDEIKSSEESMVELFKGVMTAEEREKIRLEAQSQSPRAVDKTIEEIVGDRTNGLVYEQRNLTISPETPAAKTTKKTGPTISTTVPNYSISVKSENDYRYISIDHETGNAKVTRISNIEIDTVKQETEVIRKTEGFIKRNLDYYSQKDLINFKRYKKGYRTRVDKLFTRVDRKTGFKKSGDFTKALSKTDLKNIREVSSDKKINKLQKKAAKPGSEKQISKEGLFTAEDLRSSKKKKVAKLESKKKDKMLLPQEKLAKEQGLIEKFIPKGKLVTPQVLEQKPNFVPVAPPIVNQDDFDAKKKAQDQKNAEAISKLEKELADRKAELQELRNGKTNNSLEESSTAEGEDQGEELISQKQGEVEQVETLIEEEKERQAITSLAPAANEKSKVGQGEGQKIGESGDRKLIPTTDSGQSTLNGATRINTNDNSVYVDNSTPIQENAYTAAEGQITDNYINYINSRSQSQTDLILTSTPPREGVSRFIPPSSVNVFNKTSLESYIGNLKEANPGQSFAIQLEDGQFLVVEAESAEDLAEKARLLKLEQQRIQIERAKVKKLNQTVQEGTKQ
jgi:hypothetical protein